MGDCRRAAIAWTSQRQLLPTAFSTSFSNCIADWPMQQRTPCIVHIDMDAFYAQVEQHRLGLDASVPLGSLFALDFAQKNPADRSSAAVQQWQGLIAVSYAARAFGIKRHDTAPEALKKCPQLRLVHVATYKEV